MTSTFLRDRMLKFSVFLLLISEFKCNENSATLIDIESGTNQAAILIDEVLLQKVSNQIENVNIKNEIISYRLERLGERFAEHEKLLRNLTQNTVECKIEKQKIPTISVRSISENEQQFQPQCFKHEKYARNCAESIAVKQNPSGLHSIQIDFYSHKPFLVFCNNELHEGGWTVVQRRQDGSIDFYRDWASYKHGFGNLNGEFFIGLGKLHALTTDEPQELLIVMTDFENGTKYAKYDAFAIGDEQEFYAIKALGAYTGDAGDSLRFHVDLKFTTKDRKNDNHSNNCAIQFTGAWWYDKCHVSNLNGRYLKGSYNQDQYAQGVVWKSWRGYNYSLKTVEILIRPKRF